MRSCSELGFWSVLILTGFKVSLAPQQTLKDHSSEQIGSNSLLRNTVRYLQFAVSISNSLSLITSSRGCFCSVPVCLGAQQSSLAQWAVNMSASCVEGTSKVNELSLDNKSCEDISFYSTPCGNTRKGCTQAPVQLAMPAWTPTRLFTRPGQGLGSSAFSNANTHISLKVNCRAGVEEQREIKQGFILGLQQNNKAFHNSWKHLLEFFSDDWQRGWEDRHGHSLLAIRCLLSSHRLCNFLAKILYYFCDSCHKGKIG